MKDCNKIPNLFIVGAAKSGTTALWHYLKQHPQILMTDSPKEPSFFSDFGKYIFSTNIKTYLKLFDTQKKNRLWFGDASTAYLTDPTSSRKIFEYNNNAKIIAILRNPVDRAYSLYNFMAMSGLEYAKSFEKALKLENSRISTKIPNWFEPHNKWNYLYFNSGLYSAQIERYLRLFKDKVLVIKYDDFAKSPVNTLQQVCTFLKIKNHPIILDKHNVTQNFHSAEVQFISRECEMPYNDKTKTINPIKHLDRKEYTKKYLSTLLKLLVSGKLSYSCIKHTCNHFFRIHKNYSPEENIFIFPNLGLNLKQITKINFSTRKCLVEKYTPDVNKLSKIINLNLDDWLDYE